MTFTVKFAAAGVNTNGASVGVPVPLFAPATRVQVDPAVPLALVFAEAGLNELPAVLVANATGMLSIPAWLLRVVAVTVTGAVVVVALRGMNTGDVGPVLLTASLESTPANGLNFLTVPPVEPPVGDSEQVRRQEQVRDSIDRAAEQAGRLEGQGLAGKAEGAGRQRGGDLNRPARGGDDVVARRDI